MRSRVERHALLLEARQDERRHHGHVLHVDGAAAPQIAVVDLAGEGGMGPALRLGRHDVEVRRQEQRRLLAGASEPRDHVLALGRLADQRRRQAGGARRDRRDIRRRASRCRAGWWCRCASSACRCLTASSPRSFTRRMTPRRQACYQREPCMSFVGPRAAAPAARRPSSIPPGFRARRAQNWVFLGLMYALLLHVPLQPAGGAAGASRRRSAGRTRSTRRSRRWACSSTACRCS